MGLLFPVPFHFYTVWADLHNTAPIQILLLLTFVCFVESGTDLITNTPWVIFAWMLQLFNLAIQQLQHTTHGHRGFSHCPFKTASNQYGICAL